MMTAIDRQRDALLAQVATVDPDAALTILLGAWLSVETPGDPRAEADAAAVRTGGARSYRDVAVLGYAVACGLDAREPFAKGLAWLAGRGFARPGGTPTLEADPMAMLGLAVGIRAVGADGGWLATVARKACAVMTDDWHRGVAAGALAVLGEPDGLVPTDLALALRGRGAEIDAPDGLEALNPVALACSGPERAIVRLAALRQLAPGPRGSPSASVDLDQVRTRATIGIITALPKECAAVRRMLTAEVRWKAPGDGGGRDYYLGQIPAEGGGSHHVALAVLPDMGNNSAALIASNLLHHFPSVRQLIMCGIAGGVPRPGEPEHDVRLGDVVVSNRNGVIQYDLVKECPDGSREHRHPPRPPGAALLSAVRHLQTEEEMGRRPWEAFLAVGEQIKGGKRPPDDHDAKGNAVTHPHDAERTVGMPRVFHGAIAAAHVLLKNAGHRDYLAATFGVKAIEMEGSGIADATWASDRAGYLVVRGVCDYCDGNKGDHWQGAAAVAAATYVRALIGSMPLDGA